MSVAQYFGENGPFGEACDPYRYLLYSPERDKLEQAVFDYAASLGNSRIAYTLGFCFARVLKRRGLEISEEDLAAISGRKISTGDAREFVSGFRVGAHR